MPTADTLNIYSTDKSCILHLAACTLQFTGCIEQWQLLGGKSTGFSKLKCHPHHYHSLDSLEQISAAEMQWFCSVHAAVNANQIDFISDCRVNKQERALQIE